MYSLLLKKKKRITGKNIKSILLISTALLIFSFLCLYFYSFKQNNILGITYKKLYIDSTVKDIFNIDYSKSEFNDYKISEDEFNSNLIVSKNLKSDLDVLGKFSKTYVPVVSWQNYDINDLDYDSIVSCIKSGKLKFNGRNLGFVYFDSYKDYYSTIMGSDFKVDSFKSLKDLESYKNKNDFIALLEVKDMQSYFKSLKINSESPFLGEGDEYKLVSTYYLQRAADEEDDTINFLRKSVDEYNESKKITNILAVGDIMLSRDVGIKIRKSGDNSLPFKKLYNLLNTADITFGNLESPFYDKGPPLDIGMSFKADPKYIEGIVLSGFDVLSLANNHFGNQGRAGMEYTFEYLINNDIKYCGAGHNYSEAHSAAVLERNNINFSFLSYNLISPQGYEASEDNAGLAFLSNDSGSLSGMSEDIKREKAKGNVVITSFHWGVEYVPKPTDRQRATATAAIVAGADIIISQHPHVVQGMDFIEGKPVLYSLGNFVFDQMWSNETREGVMSRISLLDNKVVAFEFIPIIIDNYNQPRLGNDNESNVIIKRIIDNSHI